MKKIIIIMIMVLSFVSLFAQKYEIVSYDISTKGRTKESAVYNLIGGDEGTIVDDCDELHNLIEEKKQTLLNKRIFKNVVVSYEEQKEDYIVPVIIKVNVESAIAMIVTPGGQFDSNYGFGFGAVFEDMNFLGSTNEIEFAVAAFQKDNSFKQGSFASNFVYGFNLLGTRIDTNTKVQINKSDKSLTLG